MANYTERLEKHFATKSRLTKSSQRALAKCLNDADLFTLANAVNKVSQEEYTRIESGMIEKYGLKVREVSG